MVGGEEGMMTTEEAIEILQKIKPIPHRGDGKSTTHILETIALDMAIKALEQQPCEDCISRQEAISAIQDEYYADAVGIDIVDIIAHLPSVTPTRPTGRWIRWYEVIESADGKSTDHIPHCKCSECGTKYDPHSSQFIKYCNECGARMVESEDEE